MSATRRPLEAAGKLHTRVVELTALCAELERARQSAEAALLAKSADYDALVAERDMLKDDLAFVERWANHHATKSRVSPSQALGVIQHYPAISDITKSYADGVVPATRNPWAELKALQARIDRAQEITIDGEDGAFLTVMHANYGKTVRLLVSDDRPSHTAGEK